VIVRFWIVEQLFKVLAALVDWDAQREQLGYEGREQPAGEDAGRLQLRWLVHPLLGLPRESFIVWRNRNPHRPMTKQQLADMGGWEMVERVGLPVDAGWGDTGYSLGEQGRIGALRSPREAARSRLDRGAPRIGWAPLAVQLADGPHALPPWEPVDLDAYLDDLLAGRLVAGIHAMLRDRPNGLEQAAYEDREDDPATLPLKPRLLLGGATALPGGVDASATWPPLGMTLLAAGTDPLASLALGFGTALYEQGEGDDLYLVSMPYRLERPGGDPLEFQLADIVGFEDELRPPDRPAELGARRIGRTRPQVTDGPALDSVGVSWRRTLNPQFALAADDRAASMGHAVGRLGGDPPTDAILLARRPPHVGGWQPFAASKPAESQPVLFCDQRLRAAVDEQGNPIGDPLGYRDVYAVAAQDVFGRYSGWSTVDFAGEAEPPQAPAVVAATLDRDGTLTVDVGWDWSDRSPELIELVGAYAHDPATTVLDVQLVFHGDPTPSASGGEAIPLDPERNPAGDWGAAQDRDPLEPETRFYRLRIAVPLDFGGQRMRELQVRARGQCHLHERVAPGWNVGPFGAPRSAVVYDPAPPPPPSVPEAPQWASVPDAGGVSRALLEWPSDARAAGYAVYEATETSLLAALGRPAPDTARPLDERLATLRASDLPRLRPAFRRVRKELVRASGPTVSHEVELPRGSAVLHLYAITAVSHNQVESDWPATSRGFVAVAAPRLARPHAPSLTAGVEAAGGGPPSVRLEVELAPGPAVAELELYRSARADLAEDVDAMGPPLTTLQAPAAQATFVDAGVEPSWQPLHYRAVAWSGRDDLRGVVEGRSPASAAVSVLLAPADPPGVAELRVDEPGSTATESLVSWSATAPVAATPVGSHLVVLEAGRLRLEGRLEELAAAEVPPATPPAAEPDRRLLRVGTAAAYRIYAWVPRAETGEDVSLTAKVIDPLGRIGRLTAVVPGRRP